MPQIIFAIIIAVFFWSRATKEVEEKTQLASRARTALYFVLLIVVGIFYYKTYQVATIYNYVNVESWRETRDSLNNTCDTVTNITITNRFSSGGIFNREVDKYKSTISNSSNYNPINIEIGTHVGQSYHYETRKGHENELIYKAPFDNLGPVYKVTTITTAVPSFIPVFYTFEEPFKYRDLKYNLYYLDCKWFDLNKHPDIVSYGTKKSPYINKKTVDTMGYSPFPNAYACTVTNYFNADVINNHKGLNTYKMDIKAGSNLQNTIGFFTAADISQYVCNVQIYSNCHVRELAMVYDMPIKVPQYDSCISVGPYAFTVKGNILDENLHDLEFHVELPTMANLQLIRSLLLTTLLTALASLFFSNLYYLTRKWALQYKEDHIAEINQEKLKQFKNWIYLLFFCLLCFIVYLSLLLYTDRTIEISLDWLYFIIISIAIIFVLLIVYTLMKFKKIYIKKK
jgi:hypothetical protein